MTPRTFLLAFAATACLTTAPLAYAYPPAPDHILFGTVRDERGRPLDTGEATVIFSSTAGEIVRGPIAYVFDPGVNYELHLPMDSGTLAGLYKPTALLPLGPFTARILRGNVSYLPLEVSALSPNIGQPGVRSRLDLTIGIDSDGDGIPDAWEQDLIDSDNTGKLNTLADVTPGGDLDGDGLTNLQEYLLGTYALDRVDGLTLDIVEIVNGHAHLRFTMVRGRTYIVKTSADMKTWTTLNFSFGTPDSPAYASFRATEITPVDVWVTVPATGGGFFQLYVE